MNIQFVFFLNCICIGIVVGCFYDFFALVKKLFQNIIVSNCLDFIVFFVGGAIVFLISGKMLNYSFSLFHLLGYVLGIIIEKRTLSKMFANFLDMVYNFFIKLGKSLRKRKIFNKILK